MDDQIATVTPQVLDTTIVEQLTRSEVLMQVETANRFPRSIDTFKKKALTLATKDAETAQSCFYTLPRGGKSIEGPSVRLAEIVAGAYKNLRCETRLVGEGAKTITAQSTCWDMENNVLIRVETSRRITSKDGKRYNDDMIVMTGNAAAAIAFRNAIFKVVPFAYIKPIYEQCKRVALGGKGVDTAKEEWFAVFEKRFGVSSMQLLDILGKKHIDDVDLEDVSMLQGAYTAIEDGTTTVDSLFPPAKPAEGSFGFKPKTKPKPESKAEPKKPEPPKKPAKKPAAKKKPVKPSETKAAPPPNPEPEPAPLDDEPPPPGDDDQPWDKHLKDK